MKDVNLNLMESFFAVYKYGSYTKAAIAQGLTFASIVKRIKNLEDHTGTKLFIKQKASLHPTKEGKRIYESTYEHYHAFKLELENLNLKKEKFYLDIVTSTGASLFWLISKIKEFSKINNNFKFRIHPTENSIIDSNLYDIIALPKNIDFSEFKKNKVTSFTARLYASQEYLNEHGIPKTPEDLDNHKLISFYHKGDDSRGDLDWILRVGRNNSDPRDPFLIVNNSIGIIEAISNGLGIGALTDNNQYIMSNNLVHILPELSSHPAHLYVSYNVLLGNNAFVRFLINDIPKAK